ncbi:hypothetical protein AB1286_20065 [Trinickia sp. NRRL B-1857]|uniref:hypothetical protein n=1 Tax=Trinickia sp. NRRL B-1857 TaxID=3162879 RepID=UPI003D2CF90C
MRAILLAVVGAAAVSACASSSSTYAPDGRRAYTLNCSGLARTWGACYNKAGKICGPAGYDVLAGGSESGAIVGAGAPGFMGGTTISRSMLIACKQP